MYTLSVNRDFTARHYLIGGDWGEENRTHSHNYRLEVTLEGPELNRHGFLLDIVELEDTLESILETYANKVLNDLPEFAGLNPSIENLARIVCGRLGDSFDTTGLRSLTVTIWEDEKARAGFRSERQ